jgi:hypothetical protein
MFRAVIRERFVVSFLKQAGGGEPRLCQKTQTPVDEKPQHAGGPRNECAIPGESGNLKNYVRRGCAWPIALSISRGATIPSPTRKADAE